MAKRELVCPGPECAPANEEYSRGHISLVPYDLLKDASRRLGIMCLLAAALWIVGTVLYHLVNAQTGQTPQSSLATDMIAVVSALLSLVLFFYTRQKDRDPQFILDVGLAYLVLSGLALGLTFHWNPPTGHPAVFPMITWIGAVVVISAAIVPNVPVKILVAGLITVSMNPLAMVIAKARGIWDFGPSSNILVMHYPDYLLVAVAVVISMVMTGLGQQVTRAREMGSYQLISLVGKGGMGEVWRARHRMLARDAAIKIIHPHMLSANSGKNAGILQKRFEQEAKSTAALRSPHTVGLYDFGVTSDGAFYYVMELLEGIDLEALVQRFGPLPPARAVHVLRQVCRSLAEAHSHEMVHRDIKATNIILCRLGNEFDFVKVLDFGLVKVRDPEETQMTLPGSITGTPAFMAPELALGKPDIDGRADIYALGCVAYWLITGKQVFEENGGTAMMLAHLNKPPVPPSERTPNSIPSSLDRVIMACLAKDPADRPPSAAALEGSLERILDTGVWNREDAERWWHANMSDNSDQPPPQQSSAPSAFSTV